MGGTMISKKILFIFVILTLVLNISYSESAAVPRKSMSKKEMIEFLMEISGFNEQMKGAFEMSKQLVKPGHPLNPGFSLGKKLDKILLESLTGAMKLEDFNDLAYNYFDSHFDQKNVEHILEFYKNPWVLKITEFEIKASCMDPMKIIYLINQENNLDFERLDIIREFKRKTKSSERNEKFFKMLIKSTKSAFLTVYSDVLPKRYAPDIEASSIKGLAAYRTTMEHVELFIAYYAYKDIPLDNLKEYFEFHYTEPGKWYADITYDAIFNSVLKLHEKGVKKFLKIMRAPKKRAE
jgi:hypothetical protein